MLLSHAGEQDDHAPGLAGRMFMVVGLCDCIFMAEDNFDHKFDTAFNFVDRDIFKMGKRVYRIDAQVEQLSRHQQGEQ